MVIFILPCFSGGGAERVAINLMVGLKNLGHSVGVVVFNKSGPLLSMIPVGIPVYSLDKPTLRSSIVPLIKKIKQLKPKVIFSSLGYINVALLAVRWLLPRKTKVWIREANMPSISLPNNSCPRLMIFLYKLFYGKSDKLICTSKRMREEFILDFSISESIIEVLPNPVDVSVICRHAAQVKRFDNGGVCYVASGRLTIQKGFDRLLCWFYELEDKRSTLTILGDGELKNKLIEKVKSLKLQGRVKFLGFCYNPWQWYAGADVFLLASRWEGMPNSALESLACGTPVIATEDSGGIKEIIKQKTNNSIIVVSGVQQFVKAMNSVKIKNQNYLSDSLLPERYKQENVVRIIEGWLDEVK